MITSDSAGQLLFVRAAGGGARLLLTISCGGEKETLSVMTARFPHLPKVGALTAEEVAFLREEAAFTAAVEAGLRALSACGASERHLIGKLRARGFSAKDAAAAAAFLRDEGLLREVESALREVETALRKLWGDSRVLLSVAAKGYSKDALSAARARLQDEDEEARCRALAAKLKRGAKTEAQTARALYRFGYPPEMIRALCRTKEE